MDFIECLIEYGLTRQEATIYTLLLGHGAMTGYEVAKETGISKSNVYSGLKGLAQKGAAVCEEREATRYIPVELESFCNNHLRYLGEVRGRLIKNQPRKAAVTEGYITIQGHRNIKNKIYEMLDKCEYRLYIMANHKVVSYFADAFSKLAQAGKKIVILSDMNLSIDGASFYQLDSCDEQIRLVVDSGLVITGVLGESEDDKCLYSGQETLVNLVKETIKSRMLLSDAQ